GRYARKAAKHFALYALGNRVFVRLRHQGAFAPSQNESVYFRDGRRKAYGRIRACRIAFGDVRRQFELARSNLVSGKLSSYRISAKIRFLLRRRFSGRISDRLGKAADALGNFAGIVETSF